MEERSKQISILDLPDDLSASICDYIKDFTVALLRVVVEENIQKIHLIGSGTLVIVNGVPSILTVEHVLAQLRNSDQLGLLTSFRGNPHRYIFNQQHINVHKIAKGDDPSNGPDIGLITLSKTNIGRLQAEKSFYNIDKRIERFRNGFIQSDRGFWFTCGFPGEFEVAGKPESGFAGIQGYQGLFGISGIRREYDNIGYDYIEMSIEYGSFSPTLPASFGGLSGSGVWQVLLRENSGGHLVADEYILSGIVFYQTELKENHRILRCHGRKAIYEIVPTYFNSILVP